MTGSRRMPDSYFEDLGWAAPATGVGHYFVRQGRGWRARTFTLCGALQRRVSYYPPDAVSWPWRRCRRCETRRDRIDRDAAIRELFASAGLTREVCR